VKRRTPRVPARGQKHSTTNHSQGCEEAHTKGHVQAIEMMNVMFVTMLVMMLVMKVMPVNEQRETSVPVCMQQHSTAVLVQGRRATHRRLMLAANEQRRGSAPVHTQKQRT